MNACVICGEAAAAAAGMRSDLVRCVGCGLIYNPNASENRDDFSSSYYRAGVYADYDADRTAIALSAHRRLRVLERRTTGRRLLDVGCAAGFFLDAARQRGWDVAGLELSVYAAGRARSLGLTVYEGSILEPPPLRPFDVVTMWDTIEHLARPDIAVQKAAGLLSPDGILAVSTGDCGSLVARACGRRWRLLSDPTHKFFFSEHTLGALLKSAGFRPVAVGRPGKWVSSAMILHQLGIGAAARASQFLVQIGMNPPVYVNLRDVVTVVSVRDSATAH
jgi:SAM-dependent methyltransferase